MSILGLSIVELVIIGVCALGAQVVGGLAGYGTGLLMPLVLVPILGPQAIVPVISLSAILTNLTRMLVFREHLDIGKAALISAFAIPSTLLGAHFYSLLSSRGAATVIGSMLIVIVPLRRFLAHRKFKLGTPGGAVAGIVYGLLTGGTTGVGVVLISVLMAMGLSGLQIVATDALTSVVLGIAKTGVFLNAGMLPPKLILVALLIGIMATPGTLTAKWLARRFDARLHDTMIEAAILVGGAMLIWRALQS
ncbi:MAG: sulfite exporter TauE/SafE family protein [Hyphomicrobiaceae bacterium]